MIVAGLDVGTSGVKGLALDTDCGSVVGSSSVEYPFSTPRPGLAEQDPSLWWEAASAVLESLGKVAGIGLSGQMHGLVALDSSDRVLRPALLWNDQRTEAEASEIEERLGGLDGVVSLTGNRAMTEGNEQYVISGERNLLSLQDLSQDMRQLRQLFELFERKTSLLQILDVSLRGQGVQIFIGGESSFSAPDDVSVVTAPYKVDGEVVGTVGVIGPTRMAYDRVIPIVDITAKLLSSALSQH